MIVKIQKDFGGHVYKEKGIHQLFLTELDRY